jgi:hypothetical protein
MDIDQQVKFWQMEVEFLHETQTDLMELYKKQRAKLSQEYQKILDRAIAQRYLVLPPQKTMAVRKLGWTYENWCRANTQPHLVVYPADRYKSTCVQIYLDLDSMNPHGYQNLRKPDLDMNDETFCLMMLLCLEANYSPGHVHLKYVFDSKADEVARQLLAFYDRCYQKHVEHLPEHLKPFLK